MEYARIGRDYAGEALIPILWQTVVAVSAILAIGRFPRRLPSMGEVEPRSPQPAALLALLFTAQVGLVVLMEWTERLALGAPYAEAFRGGLLESGFVLELILSAGSALLLVLFAAAARRIVRVFVGEAPAEAVLAPSLERPARDEVLPRFGVLAGAGCVRAPPRT
jgi:hypothetical protein